MELTFTTGTNVEKMYESAGIDKYTNMDALEIMRHGSTFVKFCNVSCVPCFMEINPDVGPAVAYSNKSGRVRYNRVNVIHKGACQSTQ